MDMNLYILKQKCKDGKFKFIQESHSVLFLKKQREKLFLKGIVPYSKMVIVDQHNTIIN